MTSLGEQCRFRFISSLVTVCKSDCTIYFCALANREEGILTIVSILRCLNMLRKLKVTRR